ncbi:isopeptide-forming domain-containing fimbrial protein [Corynebacterium sp. H130]|uniref:isopeptide-forming domain-containing fimbrial protein n=1 Tax=Corynebacterium sp. H130 TaxID=3133444 RepID=UPI0030A7E8A5
MIQRFSTALALVFTLLVMGLPTAAAQTGYTLTIVKTDGQDSNAGQPVAGVPFQANQLIGMPPTSPEELSRLTQEDISVLTDASPYPMGPAIVAETNAEGLAVFPGLAPGVYLVREQPYRVGNINYLQATPFLVSISADEVVRPKNQSLPAVKETDKFCVTNEDPATFTITTGIPEPDKNGVLHQYAIVDPIDSRMSYLGNLRVSIAGHGEQELQEDVDYRHSFDQQSASVIVQFTDAGLEKLAAARAGHPETRVVTTFEATVADATAMGEIVPNTAFVIPDGWGFDLMRHVYTPISSQPKFSFQQAVYPLPENKVPDPQRLDAVAIATNPIVICKCEPGQPQPEMPGLPGWPILIGIWGSSAGSSSSAPVKGSSEPTAQPQRGLPRLSKGLASTGASVLGVALVAALLALLGWILLGGRRRSEEEEER